MVMVGFSAVRAFEVPSPHPVDEFEPNVGERKDNNTCDSRCDRGIHIHYEDEVVNVNHFRRPLRSRERGVDT